MESLSTLWNLLLLISAFLFPQLLGILLYLRLSRAPRWVAALVGAVAPGVFFFVLAPIILFSDVREAAARGETGCGMPAMAAALMLLAGTAMQVVLGLLIQVPLSVWTRRNERISRHH